MNFITPTAEELSSAARPLLWEQELDVRPTAEAERAAGIRAGRVYWRSRHDHLYALESLTGPRTPSMATVYGHWDRYEPRPQSTRSTPTS
jgi:hypothetical protein